MRWMALHFPQLSLEVFPGAAQADNPIIVTEPTGRGLVAACNPAASAAGVRPGMTLGAALALAGNLQVLTRDAAAEQAALARLAGWAGQFTPMVSLLSPEGLLLEIAGSLQLFGGIDSLTRRVQVGLDTLDYRKVSLAVAPTPLGAWLAARAGLQVRLADRKALRAFLADLPLALLELPADTLAALHGVGAQCIDDCLTLPRAGLARRFGPALPLYLDRLLGRLPDPRPAYQPPARFAAQLPLPAEVDDTGALLFAAHRLVVEMCGFLLARGGGIQRLTLSLHHRDRPATRLDLGLLGASRDSAHLSALLRERLERTRLPEPVLELGLASGEVLPLAHENLVLPGETDRPAQDWPQLIERLKARLGAEAVGGIRPHADHRPELAWRHCQPGERAAVSQPAPRPLWLLTEPAPLEEARGRPCLNGPLALRQGPERIESGWWDGRDVGRDYYVAEDSRGARYWVYRERRGEHRWWLHGVFA